MAKIEDFEKRYVTSASFQSGDDILVTEENIEPLRRALKNTNFHWISGHQIVDSEAFQSNRVFHLHERCTAYTPVLYVEHGKGNGINAINYIFIDY